MAPKWKSDPLPKNARCATRREQPSLSWHRRVEFLCRSGGFEHRYVFCRWRREETKNEAWKRIKLVEGERSILSATESRRTGRQECLRYRKETDMKYVDGYV